MQICYVVLWYIKDSLCENDVLTLNMFERKSVMALKVVWHDWFVI